MSAEGAPTALVSRLPVSEHRRWLLIFDFDGTLAPIAATPEGAVLDPRLRAVLEPLRARVGHLVVVSGRDRERLGTLLPQGWWTVGSYGLELPPELDPSLHPPGFDPERARQALERARTSV